MADDESSLNLETNLGNSGTAAGSFGSVRRLPAIHLDSWDFRRIAQEGSVMPNALVAWDVDADGVEEVILGTTEGQVLVVKPDHRVPVYTRTLAATISVVLYSIDDRRLVLVTLEGQCEVTEAFLVGGCRKSAPPTAASVSSPSNSFNARLQEGRSTSLSVDDDDDDDDDVVDNEENNNNNNNNSSTATTTVTATATARGLASHQQPFQSYVFSIPPNCFCGDIAPGNGGGMVFLGSYDCRVYAYSLTCGGVCLGSLFMQAPLSSMRCFAAPLPADTPLHVMDTPSHSSARHARTAADTSVTAVRTSVARVPLLLVATSHRLVLLGASQDEVVKLWCPSQSRCVMGLKWMHKYASATNVHTPEAPDPSSQVSESLFTRELRSLQENFIQPLWQLPLGHAPSQLPPLEEGSVSSAALNLSLEIHALLSHDGIRTPQQDSSSESVQQQQHQLKRCAPLAAFSSLFSEEEISLLAATEEDIGFPAAVDVAVGSRETQLVATTEDGRWFIFRMFLTWGSSATTLSPSSPSPPPTAAAAAAAAAAVVKDGKRGSVLENMSVSVVCISSGSLGKQGFLQRVRVLHLKGDEFCAVFVTSDGTCYAVDGKRKTSIESHVKADALSFTILAGGSTTHPKTCCATDCSCALTPSAGAVGLASTSIATSAVSTLESLGRQQQQQQQQHSLLRGPVGRTFSLVCVAVDELVIASVGGETHVSTHSAPFCGSVMVETQCASSPPSNSVRAHTLALTPHMATLPDSHCTSPECAAHYSDNADAVDEQDGDDTLMLQLGTALLVAEGYAHPESLFSLEERRFMARRLCAVGYTYEEWSRLRQMDVGPLD